MRTISTASELALAGELRDRASWIRVEVNDGASWIDLSDHVDRNWLLSVDYGEDQNGRAASATIKVKNREGLVSLSPLMVNSLANDPNVVLGLNNQIRIDAAVMAGTASPESADWFRVFDGFIDKVGIGASVLTIMCRDSSATITDAYIEDETPYGDGSTHVTTVMQQILTAWASGVTLYTPNGTGSTPLNAGDIAGYPWLIKRYQQKREPVFDALRKLADTLGFDLRYRWHPNTSAFQLQIFEPDRTATTPDRTFGATDYFSLSDPTLALQDIRNVVVVVYGLQDGQPQSVEASDATSIATYGRKWCEISEDSTSQIDTSTEAQRMADAILADLKDPETTFTIDLPFFPWAELQDLTRISANGVHLDSDLDAAVVGIRHSVTGTRSRTALTVRGKPNAGTSRWLAIQRRWPETVVAGNRLFVVGTDGASLCPNSDFSEWAGS